jgi:hypothetical protein
MTCPPGGLTGVAAVAFSVDGGPALPAQLSGSVWSAPLDAGLLSPGLHHVAMTMTDGVGNEASTLATAFEVARSPLGVSFLSLTDGTTLPPASFDVTAEAVGVQITQLTLATGAKSFRCSAATPAGTLSCTWADFDFGTLCDPRSSAVCQVTFTATAQDSAGQSASAALHVTVDPRLKSPLRLIASPKEGATVRGTFKLVTLQAGAGFSRVTCSANGAVVGSSATGKLVAPIDTLPLLDGPLTLRCTWTDGTGRTDTKSLTVRIQNWTLEVRPEELDLRGCSPRASPVELALEGFGHADPPGGATVQALEGPARAGLLSVHLVRGKTDHSSSLVPVAFGSLSRSSDDRQRPLQLRLTASRCALLSAVKEALSGRQHDDDDGDDERALTLQLRQGEVVLDSARLKVKGN